MLSVISISTQIRTHKLVRAVISNHEDNYCFYGQFMNSIDALAIASEQTPDIIIIREQMLFISLYEFIHSLLTKGIRASIVLLETSAKPYHNTSIDSMIQHRIPETALTQDNLFLILEKIRTRPKKEPIYANLYPYRNSTSLPWLHENQFFGKIISGHTVAQDYESPILRSDYGYLLIFMPEKKGDSTISFLQSVALTDGLYQKLHTLLDIYQGGNLFSIQEEKLCVWLPSAERSFNEVLFCIQELRNSLLPLFQHLNVLDFTTYCSDEPFHITKLSEKYREVSALCKYRFFVDKSLTIYSDWLTQNSHTISFEELQESIDQMDRALWLKNRSSFLEIFDRLFDYIRNSKSINAYDYVCNQLGLWYNVTLKKQKLSSSHSWSEFDRKVFPDLNAAQEHFRNIWLQLFDAVSPTNEQTPNSHINQAMLYISSHITEPITLTHVAQAVHISGAYLSTLFQRNIGKTFVQIRTEQRIEYAKILLADNYKIYEVAEKTGFESEKYFSRSFKQVTGMTPSEYRKHQKNMQALL